MKVCCALQLRHITFTVYSVKVYAFHLLIQVGCVVPPEIMLSESIQQSLDQVPGMYSGQVRELWDVLKCNQ